MQVLGAWRGVCRDDRLGGLDSNQVFSGSREDGLTVVTYRRELQPGNDPSRSVSCDAAARILRRFTVIRTKLNFAGGEVSVLPRETRFTYFYSKALRFKG